MTENQKYTTVGMLAGRLANQVHKLACDAPEQRKATKACIVHTVRSLSEVVSTVEAADVRPTPVETEDDDRYAYEREQAALNSLEPVDPGVETLPCLETLRNEYLSSDGESPASKVWEVVEGYDESNAIETLMHVADDRLIAAQYSPERTDEIRSLLKSVSDLVFAVSEDGMEEQLWPIVCHGATDTALSALIDTAQSVLAASSYSEEAKVSICELLESANELNWKESQEIHHRIVA